MKVTDKRMFTPDGELRQEYRESRDGSESGSTADPPDLPGEAPAVAVENASAPGVGEAPAEDGPTRPAAAGAPDPEVSGTLPAAGFLDLVDMLAQPILIYLGDLQLPDGKSAEDLAMARRHIDLLNVLNDKTQGNLSAQEQAIVSDLLYRLRLRYVQKTT